MVINCVTQPWHKAIHRGEGSLGGVQQHRSSVLEDGGALGVTEQCHGTGHQGRACRVQADEVQLCRTPVVRRGRAADVGGAPYATQSIWAMMEGDGSLLGDMLPCVLPESGDGRERGVRPSHLVGVPFEVGDSGAFQADLATVDLDENCTALARGVCMAVGHRDIELHGGVGHFRTWEWSCMAGANVMTDRPNDVERLGVSHKGVPELERDCWTAASLGGLQTIGITTGDYKMLSVYRQEWATSGVSAGRSASRGHMQ